MRCCIDFRVALQNVVDLYSLFSVSGFYVFLCASLLGSDNEDPRLDSNML